MLAIHQSPRPDLLNVRHLDLAPMAMVRHMERVGTGVDLAHLKSLSEELGDKKADLERAIRKRVPADRFALWKGTAEESDDQDSDSEPSLVDITKPGPSGFNLNSPEQVAWFLFDTLGLGDGRNLKRTANGQRISTGKKQLETLKKEHDVVKLLLDYREAAKLKSTYADALPKKAVLHPKGWCPICSLHNKPRFHLESHYRIHTTFTSTRTETGRFASKRPNLQNIPKRTKVGKKIRQAFIPQPGMRWVSADFSQIELRLLAHYSQDPYMRHIYSVGGDIHTMTALKAFGITEAEYKLYDAAQKQHFDDYMRLPCKNVNFGIVYGLTAVGLQAQLAISGEGIFWSIDECQDFIDKWFSVFEGVQPYMMQQRYRAKTYGYVWDMWGRVRNCYGVHSAIEYKVEEALREAGNMPIQASSAGITKLAMAEMYERDEVFETEDYSMNHNPLLTIHDEVIYEAEESFARELLELNLDLMRNTTTLNNVPIDADGNVYDRWAGMPVAA